MATERITAIDPSPVTTAGARLRDHLAGGYRSVGLTFGSGAIPQPVPPPPFGSVERILDTLPHDTTMVASSPVERLGTGEPADRLRLVGPRYDGRHDQDHAMLGDPAAWFDVIVHQKVASSVTFLT